MESVLASPTFILPGLPGGTALSSEKPFPPRRAEFGEVITRSTGGHQQIHMLTDTMGALLKRLHRHLNIASSAARSTNPTERRMAYKYALLGQMQFLKDSGFDRDTIETLSDLFNDIADIDSLGATPTNFVPDPATKTSNRAKAFTSTRLALATIACAMEVRSKMSGEQKGKILAHAVIEDLKPKFPKGFDLRTAIPGQERMNAKATESERLISRIAKHYANFKRNYGRLSLSDSIDAAQLTFDGLVETLSWGATVSSVPPLSLYETTLRRAVDAILKAQSNWDEKV